MNTEKVYSNFISKDGTMESATLSTSAVTATTASVTINVPESATLVSWDLQYRKSGSSSWLLSTSGITNVTTNITGLEQTTLYEFRGNNVRLSSSTGIITATTETQSYLSLATSYTYVSPGGLRKWSNIETSKAYICDVYIPGGNTFTALDVWGISTGAISYKIVGMYVGNSTATELTENISTGFVTIFNNTRTVSAGTETNPGFTKVTPAGGFQLQTTLVNSCRVVVELSAGAEQRLWGVPYESTGWEPNGDEQILSTLPSSSFTLTGTSQSFGTMPNLLFGFSGLGTPVVTIPLIGDSHIQTFGDDGGINGRRGLATRLEEIWITNNKPYIPLQLGIQGLPTPSILTMWQKIASVLDLRCVVYEGISINNYNDGYGYPDQGGQALSDTALAKSIMPAQPFWVIIPGTWTMISSDQAKKANYRAAVDTLKTIYVNSILSESDGGIWNSSTLEWLLDYSFGDGGHFSSSGYDQWATLIEPTLTSLIDSAV